MFENILKASLKICKYSRKISEITVELVNGSLPYPFYVICILRSQSDHAILMLKSKNS